MYYYISRNHLVFKTCRNVCIHAYTYTYIHTYTHAYDIGQRETEQTYQILPSSAPCLRDSAALINQAARIRVNTIHLTTASTCSESCSSFIYFSRSWSLIILCTACGWAYACHHEVLCLALMGWRDLRHTEFWNKIFRIKCHMHAYAELWILLNKYTTDQEHTQAHDYSHWRSLQTDVPRQCCHPSCQDGSSWRYSGRHAWCPA